MAATEEPVQFQTTAWTLLGEIQGGDPAAKDAALAAVVSRYWPPVYSAVRAMGQTPDAAADITQAFFCDVVLARGLFDIATQERGRLRCLIRAALKNFLVDHHRKEAPGRRAVVNLEAIEHEELSLVRGGRAEDPDRAFDIRWAAAVIEEALCRAEGHFREAGKDRHWELFHARCIAPALRACDPPPMARLAADHGFPTPADASAAVQVVKKRVSTILRAVVSETTAEEDPGTELRYLLSLLNAGT